MITNPHAGTSTESGWAMGFAFGFMGSSFSDSPPAVIAPELIDAFSEGQLAGQQAAADGIELSSTCVDLLEEPLSKEIPEWGGHIIELGMIIKDMWKLKHVAGGVAGAIILVIELGIPPFTPTPEEMFPSLTQRFTETLDSMGIDSGELFIGMGIDMNVPNCEVQFTRVFKTADQARQAVAAMGRPNSAIAHWQLNASGNLDIIEVN
jgi:hypothetical protein